MTSIQVGQRAEFTKLVTRKDILAFARASGDDNPVHLDEEYAASTVFKKPIAHGMLVAGLISALLGTVMPGPGTIYLGQKLKFKAPVFIGDTVTVKAEVLSIRSKNKIVTIATNCYNQDNLLVIEGEATVMAP